MCCKDHLVMNKNTLERNEAWALLRFIGFNPCNGPEFSHDEASEEKWCFGNRDGTADTDRGWDEDEEDDDDDDVGQRTRRPNIAKVAVMVSSGKNDELARIDWSGMK